LITIGAPRSAHVRQGALQFGEHRIVRGRDVVTGEEVLGEGLGAFQLRGDARRPEAGEAGGAEAVDDAGGERRLGTDHGQGDVFLQRQLEQSVDVGRGDLGVAHARFRRRAGIARRDDHVAHARRLLELPGQRVLAAAGTDDEDFHDAIPSVKAP
jgi:hypothetical protein